MTVSSANRTALFIDGVNLYSTAKALGFDIDYKRLLKEFQSHGTLVRAFYYTVAKDATTPIAEPAWALPSLVLCGTAADPKTEERHRKAAVGFFLIGVRTK
jgi:uncharacterized LabA/DUF88 family protein